MRYSIYTDGSYSMQKNKGGFAYVMYKNDVEIRRRSWPVENETNNRAELKAIIAAVHHLPLDATEVIIYSDSQYALNTLFGTWKRAKNQDLFQVWDKIWAKKQHVKFHPKWVKGHDGCIGNEICDTLASQYIQ